MTQSLSDITQRIVQLATRFAATDVKSTSSLLSTGLMTPADMSELLSQVEWEYGVEFPAEELRIRTIEVPLLLAAAILVKLNRGKEYTTMSAGGAAKSRLGLRTDSEEPSGVHHRCSPNVRPPNHRLGKPTPRPPSLKKPGDGA